MIGSSAWNRGRSYGNQDMGSIPSEGDVESMPARDARRQRDSFVRGVTPSPVGNACSIICASMPARQSARRIPKSASMIRGNESRQQLRGAGLWMLPGWPAMPLGSAGLTKWALKPAAWARRSVFFLPWPETATSTTRSIAGNSRICRAAKQPSIPGRPMSSSMISG